MASRAIVLLVSSALLAACAVPRERASAVQDDAAVATPRTMAELLAASAPEDWKPIPPEDTLELELPAGRVVIWLAPAFAPRHAQNLRALARGGYFDGLAILRSQDNFVVQWGDPDSADEAKRRPVPSGAERTLPPEFTAARDASEPFGALPDADGFAPEVGFTRGFAVGRDRSRSWLAHCYGVVGAGRDVAEDSGGGTELYVVTGHAPRQLDRNITVVGRVVHGIEHLSTLPRGSGALGFYERAEQRVPIRSVRVAADLPPEKRIALEALRTDRPVFAAIVEARRNRRDEWYKVPAGYIDLCNVPLPVRAIDPARR